MKIFLDTAPLIKLYHKENDTAAIDDAFATKKLQGYFFQK